MHPAPHGPSGNPAERERKFAVEQTIDLTPYVAFEATGVDRNGRRNSPYRGPLAYIRGLNYWRKSVWGILPNGRRKLLYRVYN